ncbi:uncharacterized protein TNCV_4611901 [Trichonephila clavipes]|nr:uncharacterized protein TNCV_4611901 [Trichonephila clavipes]
MFCLRDDHCNVCYYSFLIGDNVICDGGNTRTGHISNEDVKSLVYADKPQTLDHLEENIRRVITDIRPQMLENVIENWTSRLDYIRASLIAVGSLVVRASDSRPDGLGSMLDVTKYPPSAHGFTCRNCGGGDRGRVVIYRPFGEVSLSLNRTVTCMVLKANDRRTSCPCHDEFRGPRSDYVRQVALATTTTTTNYKMSLKFINFSIKLFS